MWSFPVRDFTAERLDMVERQIAGRGVADPAVLGAMRRVNRELFVPEAERGSAYHDGPLPIGLGQTISQPYIVALMAEAARLKAGDRVLEIGAGSGYAAAIYAEMGATVFTIERHAALAEEAAKLLARLGYDSIEVRRGDGTLGWAEKAPFDAIIAAAGGPSVPRSLTEQLAEGGRLVMPVGPEPRAQELVRLTRTGEGQLGEERLGAVWFVPLIGAEGWTEDDR